MDVSKLDEWSDLRVKVEMDFGLVQFLMLNAGIGLKSGWEDVEYFQKVHTFPHFHLFQSAKYLLYTKDFFSI